MPSLHTYAFQFDWHIIFQHLIDFVLCGLSYLACLVYLDDIIVYGRTFAEQLVRLREVFGRMRTAYLKIHPSVRFSSELFRFLDT